MSNKNAKLSEIERYILFSKNAVDRFPEALNLPRFEKRTDYKNEVAKIDYWHYIQSGDHHYFVSRVLFLHHVTEYAFFCAQQCVENYLKAYLKYHGEIPHNTHDLIELLKQCKGLSHSLEPFIVSDHIETIAQKFNPFNEVARYPIQRKRPKDGQYLIIYPDDIFVLDYFVYRMRELVSIPSNTWDILRDGHFHLQMCIDEHPDFYAVFKQGNINFS